MTFEKNPDRFLTKSLQWVVSSGLREKNVTSLARHPGIEVAWILLFPQVHAQSGGIETLSYRCKSPVNIYLPQGTCQEVLWLFGVNILSLRLWTP